MGMVVGHEITHGFDDQGRHFDALGNLKEWWTTASDEAFRKRAACVKEKYDQEIAVDDIHVNGALTLGENVADMGGVKLALAAMRSSSKEKGQKSAAYRYSEDQQFFLGFAQLWCAKRRPEYMRKLAVIDPHSPPALRVDVPLKNLKAFQDAFQCKPDSKMVAPPPRCEVW
jgi:endothelin-converting enzyme/putative endopeptidase